MNKVIMTTDKVKQMDMVNELSTLGFKPIKIVRQDYWYLSPFRNERCASFKINRHLNAWYDHGEGCGGNLVDFAVKYFQCSVKEALQKFSGENNLVNLNRQVKVPEKIIMDPKIQLLKTGPIEKEALIYYLNKRKISLNIARQYCEEVDFNIHQKSYYAIGFKNNLGGYELRNAFFKGSLSLKGITFFDQQTNVIKVFEGFFNFLSYQTICENKSEKHSSFLILNSLSFFEKQKELLDNFDLVHLYLDNDDSGKMAAQRAMQWSNKFRDESQLYIGYKDLNEWHCNKEKMLDALRP